MSQLRVCIDALGSVPNSGGMRMHATHLVREWATSYPQDRIDIVGPEWCGEEFASHSNVEVHVRRNEPAVRRSFGQLFASPWIARRVDADCLVSLSPVVSPFFGRTIAFQHDWRHKKNPQEFPRIQREYRRLWEWSARRASVNACISAKAQIETITYVPRARTILVPNGGDHAREWGLDAGDVTRDGNYILTFGHQVNKRPDLVIRAMGSDPMRGNSARLVVLGATGNYREQLYELAVDLGIADRLDFPGFVSSHEHRTLMAQSSAIVLASSDEGYGLPLAEADFLGKPAVVTLDSGVHELFPRVLAAEPSPQALSTAISTALLQNFPVFSPSLPGWEESARSLRQTALRLSANRPGSS